MFDGAAPVVVETSISDADAGDATAQETTDAAQQAETAFAREQENLATVDSSDTAAPPVQVVVYDAGIQDIDSLIANLSGDIKAYALPAGQDPFEAIAAILKEAGTVETLYVLSHGSEGKMYLGDEVVDQATLESRADTLAGWSQYMSADADIMLYGCDIGFGDAGQAFVNSLARLTDADVAASSDGTGATALGGNWTLETTSGSIEAASLSQTGDVTAYDGLLATIDLSSASLTGWTAFTPANNQNDYIGDQQTGSGSVPQDIVGDGTYRSAYVHYDNGGTSNDVSDDWISFRIRVNSTNDTGTISKGFDSFAFIGVDYQLDGDIDFFVGAYKPDQNAGRVGVYDANGAGNTGPSDTGIAGSPSVEYDKNTTGYSSQWSFVKAIDGSSFSSDPDYFISFKVKVSDINDVTTSTGNLKNVVLSDSSNLRYIVGTAAQDNSFNQDISGMKGFPSSSNDDYKKTWEELGTFTPVLNPDGTVAGPSISSSSITFQETVTNGTTVRDVNDASGGDTDSGGQALTYSITGGNPNGDGDGTSAYTINSSTGVITVADTDDLTAGNTHTLTIKAVDTDNISDTATVTVTVKGAPSIGDASKNLLASSSNGTTVYDVFDANSNADTDKDGQAITYSITGGNPNGDGDGTSAYTINSSTGVITVADTDDLTAGDTHTLTVKAVDPDGNSDTATITITIVSSNNAPTAAPNTVTTNEDTAKVFTSAEFKFVDTDSDTLSKVQITQLETEGVLQYKNSSGVWVDVTLNQEITKVDIDAGKLRFNPAANASGAGYDTFNFKVSDGTVYSASAYIMTIDVTAVNDAPDITSNGGAGTATVTIVEGTIPVTTVTATDAENDTLTFSLSGGVDQSLFEIDPNTGALKFKTAPDFDNPTDDGKNNEYIVQVTVSDGNGGTTVQTITIKVTEKVETTKTVNPPTVTPPPPTAPPPTAPPPPAPPTTLGTVPIIPPPQPPQTPDTAPTTPVSFQTPAAGQPSNASTLVFGGNAPTQQAAEGLQVYVITAAVSTTVDTSTATATTASVAGGETSPLGDWLRRIAKAPDTGVAVRLLETASLLPPDELSDALPGQVMWLPLAHPDGGLAGLLVLLRDPPWQERDRLLAEPLAECYGHALIAVGDRPWFRRPKGVKARMIAGGVAAFFIGAGFWPVSLTALAPAEVVAADPVPVTAPFDGIVSEVLVRPYETVTAGQILVLMDNTELTMERNLARKALAISVAELNGLRHQAFLNPGSKAKLAVWDKKVELRRQSLANAEEKLSRHRLSSPSAKVVLFDDRYNWAGRPAKAGQRLMTLADPENLEVQIDLPAASLIPLKEGDPVTLFLDMAPSRPIKARLSRIGYQARATPSGMMAYRYRATLEEPQGAAALGARGTARLEGKMVTLAYSVFRRPMSALRQFFGL